MGSHRKLTKEQIFKRNTDINSKIVQMYPLGHKYKEICKAVADMGYSQTPASIGGRVSILISKKILTPRIDKIVTYGEDIIVRGKNYFPVDSKPVDWDKYDLQGIPLMELKNNSCRFPFKNGSYCGKIAISSYCQEHHSICYNGKGKRL